MLPIASVTKFLGATVMALIGISAALAIPAGAQAQNPGRFLVSPRHDIIFECNLNGSNCFNHLPHRLAATNHVAEHLSDFIAAVLEADSRASAKRSVMAVTAGSTAPVYFGACASQFLKSEHGGCLIPKDAKSGKILL